MKRLEKWNAILWFIIGMVIVVFLSIAAIDSIKRKINQKPRKEHKKGLVVGSELEKAKSDSLALQDIRVSLPQRTFNSDYRFIRLECKDLIKPRHGIAHSSSVNLIEPKYYGIKNLVNVLFYNSDYSDVHLLLDEKANIVIMESPGMEDTLQNYILYGIVSEDTNGDSRLNRNDKMHLFLSDLSGHDLHRITDDHKYLINYSISACNSNIFLLTQNIPADENMSQEHWEQELYIYNTEDRKLFSPFKDYDYIKLARELIWQ